MNYLCEKCSELKVKKDLNIFDDYCGKCKKLIRKNDPEFYKKEYFRLYRKENKESLKKYGEDYRKDSFNLKKSNSTLYDKSKGRSRIYICKIGDYRIKIGSTCIDSQRLYVLEDKLNLIGISFEPLFYYDCKNPELITTIERSLKDNFCSSEIGINIDSLKNELALSSKLKDICLFIESKLEESGLRYSVVSFR